MATKKKYTRLRAGPGYTLKREYHVNKQEYDDYYNLHEAELAEQLRQMGYRVTKPREKALARANVNAYHHYPRAPSQWNMYVKNNIHRAMAEHNASAGEAIRKLGEEYRELYPKEPKEVAAGISGGARRPRRRAPLLRM
jgi:hypothetical protein